MAFVARCLSSSLPRMLTTRSARLLPYSATRFLGAEPQSTSFLNRDVVQDRVLEVVRSFPKIDANKVNASSHFIKDLGIDSLDLVEVTMLFEDEFNVEITDEDAEKIATVEDAIRYIASHPQAK